MLIDASMSRPKPQINVGDLVMVPKKGLNILGLAR